MAPASRVTQSRAVHRESVPADDATFYMGDWVERRAAGQLIEAHPHWRRPQANRWYFIDSLCYWPSRECLCRIDCLLIASQLSSSRSRVYQCWMVNRKLACCRPRAKPARQHVGCATSAQVQQEATGGLRISHHHLHCRHVLRRQCSSPARRPRQCKRTARPATIDRECGRRVRFAAIQDLVFAYHRRQTASIVVVQVNALSDPP